MENVVSKAFLKSRLAIVGIVLYGASLFAPWVAEEDSHFWSFMLNLNSVRLQRATPHIVNFNGWFYFKDFWSVNLGRDSHYLTSNFTPSGLYAGWLLVFLLQVSTLILYAFWLFKPNLRSRRLLVWCIVLFPIASLLLDVCQCMAQWEIQYHSIYEPFVFPYLGFWLAVAAVLLLTVSYVRQTRRKLLTRQNLLIVASVLLLILGPLLFLTNELEFQTQVTKLMYIQQYVPVAERPGNPEIWKTDFARITTVAGIFRVRVTYNNPQYCCCELEVPVISYSILLGIYGSMGYYAREPIFLLVTS
jgi:hypothetical protein